jgi:hypothetical protein
VVAWDILWEDAELVYGRGARRGFGGFVEVCGVVGGFCGE